MMSPTALACLALLSATGAAAASTGFLLGGDYSEWLAPFAEQGATVGQAATDSAGAIYVLSSNQDLSVPPFFWVTEVTKLSADAKTILWKSNLGFGALQMAVDPGGGVYVIPLSLPGDASIYVAKLSADGTGLAWKTPIGGFLTPAFQALLAVDSQGRAYVAGAHDLADNEGGVVRLNASGTAVDYTAPVTGLPAAIAVDASGAAFVAVSNPNGGFLARLAPDGSAGFYSNTAPAEGTPAIAVDSSGSAALYTGSGFRAGVLQRFDSAGALTFSRTTAGHAAAALALDAAGNAYVAGSSPYLSPVSNSLATCGSALLSVFAPDGSVLQTTYIPGAANPALILMGPHSTIFVIAYAETAFVPTRVGPFPAAGVGSTFLWHLSPNPNAQTFPLTCLGNAASLDSTRPIAPGEIVTLFGNGLGPEIGVQIQASLLSPFPTQAANVEVTFDGTPAPLLWVQDGQINTVAPWSLTPGQSTQVCVSYNGAKTNCLAWPVAQTAPAVFTVDGAYAAAVNQDGTINSADNPAPLSSIVSVWATGLGPIAPPQADGTLVGFPLPGNLVLPVGVEAPTPFFEPCHPGVQTCPPPFIDFEVTYAGPAPYMIAGASQINFRVVNYALPSYQSGSISLTLPSTQSPGFQIYVAGQ